MANRYNILVWEIPWTEEPGGYSPWGCKELETTEGTCMLLQHHSKMLRTQPALASHFKLVGGVPFSLSSPAGPGRCSPPL